MEEDDSPVSPDPEPEEATSTLSPYNEALYEKIKSISKRMLQKEENRSLLRLNEQVWSKPEVIEAVKNYKKAIIPSLEKLREVINSKTGVTVSVSALSYHVRNIRRRHVGRPRNSSRERKTEFVSTSLLNDRYTTPGFKNLHTVNPNEEKATSDLLKRNPHIWTEPVVKDALNKYRNFEITTLEKLRQVIYENAKVWISTTALSCHVRNMRRLERGRPKGTGNPPKVCRAFGNYVVKPRDGVVDLPALPLLYQPEENEAETSVDVDGEVVNVESKSPSTSEALVTLAKLKSGPRWWSPKDKQDKYASKTGRQVRGDFISKAVFHFQDGPNRNNTYSLKKKLADVNGVDPERYECVQCSHARYGARKKSRKRGDIGDDMAPLNVGPVKRIMIMPDGLVLDIDQGEHHQDCTPWTDAQMILYRERVDNQEKRKMGLVVGKRKRQSPKRSKEEYDKYMAEKEKIRKCVMRLDTVGVPMTQIGPTINYIWETLAETSLDIMPSYKAIKSIVYRQKKKLEKEANGVMASPPPSVDRSFPARARLFHTNRVHSPSDVTLEYEPGTEVVVVDSIDDDVQAPYFPYRDGPDGYGTRRYGTSQDYSF